MCRTSFMKVPPITLSKSFALPLFTTLICLACLTSSTVTAEHPPAKAEAGFTLLFNGKDMEGWTIHGGQAGWSVKPGGILRNDASVGNHNWIYYDQKTFKNFILKLEWKVAPNGNSGVFLRAKKGLTSRPFDMITIAFCSISRGQAENHGFGAPFGETFFSGGLRPSLRGRKIRLSGAINKKSN